MLEECGVPYKVPVNILETKRKRLNASGCRLRQASSHDGGATAAS